MSQTLIDSRLLSMLVCPEDKGALTLIESESVLYNERLRRTYTITDGIPVMLVDEATQLDDAEVARLDEMVAQSNFPRTGTTDVYPTGS